MKEQPFYGPLIRFNPGEPVLSRRSDFLEQPLDFYEPNVVRAAQPIVSKNYRKTQWFGCLLFYRHGISIHWRKKRLLTRVNANLYTANYHYYATGLFFTEVTAAVFGLTACTLNSWCMMTARVKLVRPTLFDWLLHKVCLTDYVLNTSDCTVAWLCGLYRFSSKTTIVHYGYATDDVSTNIIWSILCCVVDCWMLILRGICRISRLIVLTEVWDDGKTAGHLFDTLVVKCSSLCLESETSAELLYSFNTHVVVLTAWGWVKK